MKTAWIIFEFVDDGNGRYRPQVVGVFSSKESAVSVMRPLELATPFSVDSRLPDGTIEFIHGEFEMSSDGEIVVREDPQK